MGQFSTLCWKRFKENLQHHFWWTCDCGILHKGLFDIRVERYNPSPAGRAKTLPIILPDCHLVRLFVHQASHQLYHPKHEPSNLGGVLLQFLVGRIKTWFTADQPNYQWPTLPETDSSPLKMGWLEYFLVSFWDSLFSGAKMLVSGRVHVFGAWNKVTRESALSRGEPGDEFSHPRGEDWVDGTFQWKM